MSGMVKGEGMVKGHRDSSGLKKDEGMVKGHRDSSGKRSKWYAFNASKELVPCTESFSRTMSTPESAMVTPKKREPNRQPQPTTVSTTPVRGLCVACSERVDMLRKMRILERRFESLRVGYLQLQLLMVRKEMMDRSEFVSFSSIQRTMKDSTDERKKWRSTPGPWSVRHPQGP